MKQWAPNPAAGRCGSAEMSPLRGLVQAGFPLCSPLPMVQVTERAGKCPERQGPALEVTCPLLVRWGQHSFQGLLRAGRRENQKL